MKSSLIKICSLIPYFQLTICLLLQLMTEVNSNNNLIIDIPNKRDNENFLTNNNSMMNGVSNVNNMENNNVNYKCPDYLYCFDCVQDDFCTWENNQCTGTNILFQKFNKYSKCSADGTSNNILCGTFDYYPNSLVPETITYSPQKASNSNYFQPNLYCKLTVITSSIPNLKIEFSNYSSNNVMMTTELIFKQIQNRASTFKQYYEINSQKLSAYAIDSDSINFYILSKAEFKDVPIAIKISSQENDNTYNSWWWVVLISILLPFIFVCLGICCKICVLRRLRNNNAIFPNRVDNVNMIVIPQIQVNHNNANNFENEDVMTKNKRNFERFLLNELKPFNYSSEKNHFSEDCSICLDAMINGISSVIKLSCNHYFHENCIKDWISANITLPKCPICNDGILEHLEKLQKDKEEIQKNTIVEPKQDN